VFLAFLESWAPHVDQIVIVDGGSDDNSLQTAKEWIEPYWSKVKIVKTPESYWDQGTNWHALQAMNNYLIGFEAAGTDWVITVNADLVLRPMRGQNIRKELSGFNHLQGVKINRAKPVGKTAGPIIDSRAYALNKKLLKSEDVDVSFGVIESNRLATDFPIISKSSTRFSDPVNGAVKSVFSGVLLDLPVVSEIRCDVFGHFFFTDQDVLKKVAWWDNSFSRYEGRAKLTRREIKHRVAWNSDAPVLSKSVLLDNEFPQEINRVIRDFYRPDMVGARGDKYLPEKNLRYNLVWKIHNAKRKLLWKFQTGEKSQSLIDLHDWQEIGKKTPSVLDLGAFYNRFAQISGSDS
jgi:glycosyltransferase involved in cell wall biosynthesis